MTYYCKDLIEPCACAARRDAEWFLAHPRRSKYVRIPWECEAAEEQEGTSQVVGVWIDAPVNSIGKAPDGLFHIKIYRRSFLFAGQAAIDRIADDKGVDDFFALIRDGQEDLAPWGVRYN
jgi:hypothetical protein